MVLVKRAMVKQAVVLEQHDPEQQDFSLTKQTMD